MLYSQENDEFNAPVSLCNVLRNWPFALKWHFGYSSIFKDTMSHRNGSWWIKICKWNFHSRKSTWSCVAWWDVFVLQTLTLVICPPFYLKLLYLENCNSHTGKSIHFWKAYDISKLTMHISMHCTGWPRSYTGWYNKIPDKNVCWLIKADYLLAIGTWMQATFILTKDMVNSPKLEKQIAVVQ